MPKNKEEWKVYKNIFSEFSLRNLFKLASQGHFEELKSPISIGKEANIFTAEKEDGKLIVVKIYRLENCNFNKMYDYIRADVRYANMKRQKRQIVFAWAQREYRNLMIAREVIKVPTPIAIKDNILLMEYIGDKEVALKLKDDIPKDPKKFFDDVVKNMRKLYKKGLIHGDLSDFNILNHHQKPVFIDFSQGSTTDSANADELLERDVCNVCNFFKRHIDVDEKKTLEEIRKN